MNSHTRANAPAGIGRAPSARARKYVIFCRHIFTARDWERFGCDYFATRGYDVSIVQCGEALEGMDLNSLSRGAFLPKSGVATPRSHQELAAFLDRLAPTDLILALPALTRETSWLYLAFVRRRLNFIRASLAALPIGTNCRLAFRRYGLRKGLSCALWAFRHLSYRIKTRLKLIWDIGLKFFLIPYPLFWVRAGTWVHSFTDSSFGVRRGRIINVEGLEVFWAKQAESNNEPPPDGPYALFIDSALCHHPDFKIEYLPIHLDEAEYFEKLRAFFDKVESQFGMPVVISLHPKADYDPAEARELLGGRQTFTGTTPFLIKHCALTIQHQSTATVISALYRKPILFLTNDVLESTIVKSDIDSRSSWTDQPLINLDTFFKAPPARLPVPEVDEDVYKTFVETFAVAPGAHPGLIWEKVADAFEARVPLEPGA